MQRWIATSFLILQGLVAPLVAECPGAPARLGEFTPRLDSSISDWCFALPAVAAERVEDCLTQLACGRCSATVALACLGDDDCPDGETCDLLEPDTQTVWWDDRTDAVVNDLATVALARDSENLFIAIQFWIDPDPALLPTMQLAFDVVPGGIAVWYDPSGKLAAPGRCSVSLDRGCAADTDCHFCTTDTEPPPSTRPRPCGTGCETADPSGCDTSQSCESLGTPGSVDALGVFSSPVGAADYLVVVDLSHFLAASDAPVRLMEDVAGSWSEVGTFPIVVLPGAPEPGPPRGAIEFAIPWNAFGCTGCPAACDCPDFGPDAPVRFSGLVARDAVNFDYAPDGAIEDVFSEPTAGLSTTSPDGCDAGGLDNIFCELADASTDAFTPAISLVPGGRASDLEVRRNGHGATPSLTLNWSASCSAADTDYGVYEGTLGAWISHVPVGGSLCSTDGETSATFDAGVGDRYYLVVPADGTSEGSYGLGVGGEERPASAAACVGQSLGDCS